MTDAKKSIWDIGCATVLGVGFLLIWKLASREDSDFWTFAIALIAIAVVHALARKKEWNLDVLENTRAAKRNAKFIVIGVIVWFVIGAFAVLVGVFSHENVVTPILLKGLFSAVWAVAVLGMSCAAFTAGHLVVLGLWFLWRRRKVGKAEA